MTKKTDPPQQFDLFDFATTPLPGTLEQALERIAINKDTFEVTAQGLVPDGASLTFLNSYAFQPSELGRLVKTIQEMTFTEGEADREIAKVLGVPREKAKTMIRCAREMGLITTKPPALTLFGKLALEKDPYFDQTGTLWLLHYLVASNAGIVVWSRLFDFPISARGKQFKIGDVAAPFPKLFEGMWGVYSLKDRVRADVGAALRLYTDQLFSSLHLVDRVETGVYRWNVIPAQVPPAIFLSAALVYRDRYYPGASALEVSQLTDLHFAPGRLMGLPDASVRKALDELHGRRLVTVEARADLDQVRFKEGVTWLDAYRLCVEGEA